MEYVLYDTWLAIHPSYSPRGRTIFTDDSVNAEGLTAGIPKPGAIAPAKVAPRAELRAEGDRLFSNGCFAAAEVIFAALIQQGFASGWHLFQYARTAARQNKTEAALQRLEAAMAAPDAVAWAGLEKAHLLELTGAAPGQVAEAAGHFASVAPAELQAPHYEALARWAHAAFDARAHRAAGAIYDFLVTRGAGGALSRVRQADARVNLGDPRAALAMLRADVFESPFDVWAEAVRARAHIALGQDYEAAAILRRLLQLMPENAMFVHMLFGALERLEDAAALAAPEQLVAGLEGTERTGFLLRAALWRRDASAVHELCAADEQLAARHGALIAAAMHRAAREGDFLVADLLFAAAGGVALAPPQTIAAAVGHCFARRDWVRAESILGEAAYNTDLSAHPELRLRNLELYCYTLRLDQAAQLAEAWLAEGVLPEIATGTVAALFAARFQWRRVISLLQDRVDRAMRVDMAPLLQAVREAARHEDDYATVIGALDLAQLAAGPQAPDQAELKNARQALLAEWAMRRVAAGDSAAAPADRALICAKGGRVIQARARGMLQPTAVAPAERHIFYCADPAYLAGAFTGMFSVLRNNLALARGCTLWLVCTDGDADFARSLCGVVAERFGASIIVVPAGKIVPERKLRQEWGLFTPGHMLAASAYWRIFMARALLEWGHGGRALYLDSDIAAAPGLDGAFRTRLHGKALAARIEFRLAEVVEAAERIDVRPDRYFNSGVLLIDLDHAATAACLDASIDASLRLQHTLTFHDQCALNIGFRDNSFPLAPRYNMFLRPGEALPPAHGSAVVRHFLGRPKPWDSIFAGTAPPLWLVEFQLLTELLKPDQIRRLLLGTVQTVGAPMEQVI